jgi:hypothetical protein
MKLTCDICKCNLVSNNYCVTKISVDNLNTFCYDCVQNSNTKHFEFISNNIIRIIQNVPIIHLDKYNDDFSFYDYFLRIKK